MQHILYTQQIIITSKPKNCTYRLVVSEVNTTQKSVHQILTRGLQSIVIDVAVTLPQTILSIIGSVPCRRHTLLKAVISVNRIHKFATITRLTGLRFLYDCTNAVYPMSCYFRRYSLCACILFKCRCHQFRNLLIKIYQVFPYTNC